MTTKLKNNTFSQEYIFFKINFKKIPKDKKARINEQIRAREVRLIDEKGEQLGVISFQDALEKAQIVDLDLVEVSEKSDPPVCRIMDYGKELYRKNRQIQKHKARQKKRGQKGIRLSVKMSENDIETRLKQAHKFLEQGHRVKIEIILRGREKAHPEIAKENIEKFINQVESEIKVFQVLKKQPNGFNIIIAKK